MSLFENELVVVESQAQAITDWLAGRGRQTVTREIDLLERAGRGELHCPDCFEQRGVEQRLEAEFIDDDAYNGVDLHCPDRACGFREP